jgi:hypothetical protein
MYCTVGHTMTAFCSVMPNSHLTMYFSFGLMFTLMHYQVITKMTFGL